MRSRKKIQEGNRLVKMTKIKLFAAIVAISTIAMGCGQMNGETTTDDTTVVEKTAESEDKSEDDNKENEENIVQRVEYPEFTPSEDIVNSTFEDGKIQIMDIVFTPDTTLGDALEAVRESSVAKHFYTNPETHELTSDFNEMVEYNYPVEILLYRDPGMGEEGPQMYSFYVYNLTETPRPAKDCYFSVSSFCTDINGKNPNASNIWLAYGLPANAKGTGITIDNIVEKYFAPNHYIDYDANGTAVTSTPTWGGVLVYVYRIEDNSSSSVYNHCWLETSNNIEFLIKRPDSSEKESFLCTVGYDFYFDKETGECVEIGTSNRLRQPLKSTTYQAETFGRDFKIAKTIDLVGNLESESDVSSENGLEIADYRSENASKIADYCKDIHGTYGYEIGFFVDLNTIQELDDCYQMEMYATWSYTGDSSAPKDIIRIDKDAPVMLFPLDTLQSGSWTGGSDTTFSQVVKEHPGGKIWMCDVDTGSNGYITSITTLTISG